MGGANYMGGKRNAAKARTKDATTRTQKGFFGRQRLNILAKGLALDQSRVHCARKDDIRSSIDLAHAKRDAHLEGSQNVPVTPRKRTYINKDTDSSGVPATNSSDSGRQSSSSKVLTILDTTEPLSMRADMNRLLALPDFAGLSVNWTYPQFSSTTRPTTKRNRSSEDPVPMARKETRYSIGAVNSVSDPENGQTHSRISSSSTGQRPPKFQTAKAGAAYSSSPGSRSLVHDSPISMSPGPSTHPIRSHRINNEMEDILNHTGSGPDYATFNAQMGRSGSDNSASSGCFSRSPFYARSNQHRQNQILVSQSDSFILDLDTSPPSVDNRFEESQNMNHSQFSTPSSFNSYFSVVAPQPLNVFSRPMNPSQYSKQIAAHGEGREDEPLPQSSAPEPPLTFCMPSPTKRIPSWLGKPTRELENGQSSLFDGEEPMRDNLLNDSDPWNTVGKILNLDDITTSSSAQSSPEKFSYDRHGVGYVPPIPEGQQDESARDARMDSPWKRFQ